MLFLSEPDDQYKESFIEALREYQSEGLYPNWDAAAIAADFPAFTADLRSRKTTRTADRVPESILWLIDDDGATYIGRVSIRHELNDFLRNFGGHIGYDIRPSMRRRGHGMLICALALDEARRLGLRRVLLTCDEDNVASRKIIEGNGGVFEGGEVVNRPGVRTLRFWIDLDPSAKS